MTELKTEFLFEASIDLEEPQNLGATPQGNRLIFVVKGGSVEGPKLRGQVLPGGGDWFLLRPDGAGELDVRGTLRTDDGHLIYISYRGILHASAEVFGRLLAGQAVDPGEYYFRTAPMFQTGSDRYGWLNRLVAVGVGRVGPNWVGYHVYAVL